MSLPKIRNTLRPLCKVSDSLFDFKQILSFSTDFRGSPQYQIWQKFVVHWEPRCYMRTDGHDEATSRFSRLCVRALYKNTEGRYEQLHSRLRPSGGKRRWILLMNTTASEEYCASIFRDQGTKRRYMRNFSSHNQCWTKLKFTFYANSIQTDITTKLKFTSYANSIQTSFITNKTELKNTNYKHVFKKPVSQCILNIYGVLKKKKTFFVKTCLNEVWNLVCHITGRTQAEGSKLLTDIPGCKTVK